MVFNTTFNNISVVSWWSVYWWRKPKYPEKNHNMSQLEVDNIVVIATCTAIDLYIIRNVQMVAQKSCSQLSGTYMYIYMHSSDKQKINTIIS